MAGHEAPRVFNDDQAEGDSYSGALLEQYKLYVQSADGVSDRRIAASRYLLSINAAFVAAYALRSPVTESVADVSFLAVAGFALSILTYFIISSFRDLNSLKFDIIHELEVRLPSAPYTVEWGRVAHGRESRYRPTTRIELWTLRLFLVLHGAALAISVSVAVWGAPGWLVSP